jgi:hypothetical protein
MAITYEIRGDGTLVISASGALTAADLASLRTAWQNEPRIASLKSTLVDCREVTSWDLPGAAVRQYAVTREATPHLHRTDSRLAIVATTNVGFGLARLYAQSGEAYGAIEVFRTIDEAEAWLSQRS